MSKHHRHKSWTEFENETLTGQARIEATEQRIKRDEDLILSDIEGGNSTTQGAAKMADNEEAITDPVIAPATTTPSTTTVTVTTDGPVSSESAPPQPPIVSYTQVESDVVAGAEKVEAAVVSAESTARAEYDSLKPEIQSAIHQAYNDIETRFEVALPAIHTLFGAK